MQWIVTRESFDASGERALLEAKGFRVCEVPCLETKWYAWPWKPSLRGLTLFTSRRSVWAWTRAGGPAIDAVAAMAPATSALLKELGKPPSISIEGGVVALARALVAHCHQQKLLELPVYYPVSNAGLEAPEQDLAMQILSETCVVDRRRVYDVRSPPNLETTLLSSTEGGFSVLISSPSAVRYFLAAAPTTVTPQHVVCLGKSTANAWNSHAPKHWPEAKPYRSLIEALAEFSP